MTTERLQKLIARSGLCSRRDADAMIQEGRVTVNGRVAQLGDRADPTSDHVKVDGRPLQPAEPMRYLLLYKPRRVMTTCDDPEGRTTVIDLLRPVVRERVFPIGRLDYQSEGLLVITNDGDLAARVSHPRHGVVREYEVKIHGDLTATEERRLMRGAVIEGQRVRPLRLKRLAATRGGANTWWGIQVAEGRTHEVRELFFRAGHLVQRLRRTAIGPIRDSDLGPGDFRSLTSDEVRRLQAAAGGAPARRPARRTTKGRIEHPDRSRGRRSGS